MSKEKISFIVAVVIVVLVILALVIVFPVRKKYIRNSFDKHYYHKLNQIVQNNDYYLLNKFVFKPDGVNVFTIDHIIGGNKFIYIISDFFYEGNLSGSIADQCLVFSSLKGNKQYTDNPLGKVNNLLSKFCNYVILDPSLVIGIAIVNDDCKLSISGNSKQYFICQRRQVSSIIKLLEASDVGELNAKSLQEKILAIDKLNRKKR